MNWDDLKVFLAIADAGSLAGAARRLEVNHSTVFRRLNALEASLALRLFDRLPEGYVLTPAGEKMLIEARVADDAIQRIELELAGRDLAPEGTVRLTTAANIARTIVPSALRTLRKTHPAILVEVSIGDSDYDLNRREADLALRATTKPPDNLVGRQVMRLDWWICGSTALGGQPPSSVGELAGLPLIGADRALIRLQAFRWLQDNFSAQIVARANDLTTMAAFAVAGIGYALLPSDQNERGLERHLRVPVTGGQLWLLTHPELRNVRRIRAVWEAIVAATAAGSGVPA